MTRVLLDTSAYSAFMRGHPQIKRLLQHADEICLNPIVVGELLAGFLRGAQRKKNERELETFLSSPRVKLLEIERETAERYAVILNALWDTGTPIPTHDVWIAASAMQHGLRIVTTDAHYLRTHHVLVDYVEASSD
jgi:predicted nucleic acid-binding protein